MSFARHTPSIGGEVYDLQQDGCFPIPCGTCDGCRSDRKLMWTIRNTHEASQHEHKCFLTLTIAEHNMPWHGSLNKDALSQFLRYLRREATRIHRHGDGRSRPNTLTSIPRKIRFFGCGEYGDESKRAHYHALLYGLWPEDAQIYNPAKGTYTSETLSRVWKDGTHQFSPITPERIAYCCGYTLKKMGTRRDETPYGVVNPETGEIHYREPNFVLMSRRPGIGADWFNKYSCDLQRGHLEWDGSKVAIPRYYERKYTELHPEEVEIRRALRAQLQEQKDPRELTLRRLRDKAESFAHNEAINQKWHTERL